MNKESCVVRNMVVVCTWGGKWLSPTWVEQSLGQGSPHLKTVAVKMLVLVQESGLFHHFLQNCVRVAMKNGQAG